LAHFIEQSQTGEYLMKDFSQPFLDAKRLLDAYYNAAIAQNKDALKQIANELVETALKLEDISHAD